MFRKKKPLEKNEQPGNFWVTLTRRVEFTSAQTITSIPEHLFDDINIWCEDMGLTKPRYSTTGSFMPIHVVAGDSIEFSLKVDFSCGKAAMLYKLAHGGKGHIGVMGTATI